MIFHPIDKHPLVAQLVRSPPAIRETWLWSLGWENPLEEGMATHSSILTWRIPMDRGAWWVTVPGVGESDMTEWLSTQAPPNWLNQKPKHAVILWVILIYPPIWSLRTMTTKLWHMVVCEILGNVWNGCSRALNYIEQAIHFLYYPSSPRRTSQFRGISNSLP